MNKLAYLMSKVANKEDLTPAERDELIVLMEQVQSGSTWANGIADGPSGIADAVIKTGSGNIIQDETGLKLYNDAILTGWLQLDGDWYCGSNLASVDTTSFSIFSNDQTYGGESMGAGDVLLGSNSATFANIQWDASAKRFNYRTGTTTVAYQDATDGTLHFINDGSGIVFNGSTSANDASITQDNDDRLIINLAEGPYKGSLLLHGSDPDSTYLGTVDIDKSLRIMGGNATDGIGANILLYGPSDAVYPGVMQLLAGSTMLMEAPGGSEFHIGAAGTAAIYAIESIKDSKVFVQFCTSGDWGTWGLKLGEAGAIVQEFETTLSTSDSKVPTSGAVRDFLGAGYAASPLDTTITTDTFIGSYSPTTNTGSAQNISVGDDTVGVNRSLLKPDFSTIPEGRTVTAATLKLTLYLDYSTNARTLRVYRLKRAWTEGGATWNKWDGASNWQTAGGFGANDCEQTDVGSITLAADEATGEKSITLTAAAIQEMIPGGSWTNNGFLIKADTETSDNYLFRSSDYANAGEHPRIVVSYSS